MPERCFDRERVGTMKEPLRLSREAIASIKKHRDFSEIWIRKGNRVSSAFGSYRCQNTPTARLLLKEFILCKAVTGADIRACAQRVEASAWVAHRRLGRKFG